MAAPRFFLPRGSGGWTLIELVITLVIGAVLMYFAVRTYAPKEAQALQQAERLRNDVRHMQMLALTWNQALRLTTVAVVGVTPARYSVSCVSGSATPPCNGALPVIDPATGISFLVNLESGLDISGPGFTLDFDPLGRPKNGAAYIPGAAQFDVTGGGTTRSVFVAPITGFATAQ